MKHVAFEAAIARNATIADLQHFEDEASLFADAVAMDQHSDERGM